MSKISGEKKKELADLAKLLAVEGVRNNTDLEDLHCGVSPSSKIGDYSDVKVITPYGEIEWNQLSRISDEEMRSLMLSVERALLATLCGYERLSYEDKKSICAYIMTQRSYDRHDYNQAFN
ncbi:MAG: hypothetical protein FWD99_07120 [Oscillospiraceae bacterium]|nr:hypothetical protein [Oscillospiraceae bacterium]